MAAFSNRRLRPGPRPARDLARIVFGKVVKLARRVLAKGTVKTVHEPVIVPREHHTVSRADISEAALKVLYRLKKEGYAAYLVGGGVRDILLGLHPKDFDIATDATPEQVRGLFRNCRVIGRRFKLAHVVFGQEVIEVATFRAQSESGDRRQSAQGMLLRDNVYGSIEDDAVRRDFTINALYYNIADFSVVDYVGGLEDLKKRQLRMIGDPEVRYREDPVRMLRAARLAAKLELNIESATAAPMLKLAGLLREVSPARLFDETSKLFLMGSAEATFDCLRTHALFEELFPLTAKALKQDVEGKTEALIRRALANTDTRVAEDKPVTPGFLYAALLWAPVQHVFEKRIARGESASDAFQHAVSEVLDKQCQHTAIPRHFTTMMREIWTLQHRLPSRAGKRAERLFEHPRFRAAYDFLVLRADVGEIERELADWWTEWQEVDARGREALLKQVAGAEEKGAARRRKRGPRKKTAPSQH